MKAPVEPCEGPGFSGEGRLDPYFEVRTMPSNWDLSELMSPGTSRSEGMPAAGAPGFSEESPASHPAGEPSGEADLEWRPNSFPELRTFPNYWDFS